MENTKVPIYKKKWFIITVVIIALICILNISSKDKGEKIDLTKTQLGHYLPELPANNGKISVNTNTDLSIELYDIPQEKYYDYTKKCEENGFNIDVSSSSSFEAYNEKSYKIYMYLSSKNEMNISLSVPRELEKISWPTSELAKTLPVPEFDGGYINTDSSNEFSITLGNITKENYNKYVDECSSKGYNVDYNKTTDNYEANNDKGYHLEVSYNGGRRISIELESNSNKSTSTTEVEKEPEPTPSTSTESKEKEADNSNKKEKQNSSSSKSKGISKDFKKAMDTYESFMNEYVDFMKKYQKNSSDISLLSQYATMTKKYAEQVSAFEKWDSKDLTTEEAKYYVDVQARVSKKLLEVTE